MKKQKYTYKYLHLEIAKNNCNYNCIFCGQELKNHIPDYNYNFFSQIETYFKKNLPLRVNIQGGEPTISSEVFHILSRFSDYGSFIDLVTNGSNFDIQWQDLFTKAGNEVNISLNASNESLYKKICPGADYAKVLRNISSFVDLKNSYTDPTCILSLSMVVNSKTHNDMKEFYLLAKELGADNVNFYSDISSPYNILNSPTNQEIIESLFKLLQVITNETSPIADNDTLAALAHYLGVKAINIPPHLINARVSAIDHIFPMSDSENICGAFKDSLYIDHYLNVFPCCQTSLCLGNLQNDTLNKITSWENIQPKLKEFSKNNLAYCSPSCPQTRGSRE